MIFPCIPVTHSMLDVSKITRSLRRGELTVPWRRQTIINGPHTRALAKKRIKGFRICDRQEDGNQRCPCRKDFLPRCRVWSVDGPQLSALLGCREVGVLRTCPPQGRLNQGQSPMEIGMLGCFGRTQHNSDKFICSRYLSCQHYNSSLCPIPFPSLCFHRC